MNSKQISQKGSVFHGRIAPEEGSLAGYGAVITALDLPAPPPLNLALISYKHRRYATGDGWQVFTPRHKPGETLYDHLVFALKYEGINLLAFKKLFEKLPPAEVEEWIAAEPLSRYARKIWFLYEWLMHKPLALPDLKDGNYVDLLDKKLQYASPVSVNSGRHRIRNNLPGTFAFCPLIHKTEKLEEYIAAGFSKKIYAIADSAPKEILRRATAWLLLKDSKASFHIEGEDPGPDRAARWSKAIGMAGSTPLSEEELLRLQHIVLENSRFINMGYRREGGFVGERNRMTGDPIPNHISARWQDLEALMNGLQDAAVRMEKSGFHPVLCAAAIAFGFVFIHPFVDGNGRIHRYLIHHLLAAMHFTPQGIIFPVSEAILERISDYRMVLESYSHPLLNFIEWKKTPRGNVEVINETIDYYRYFDATPQAEFLFSCVGHTLEKTIPEELYWLQKHDAMETWLTERFQMPGRSASLLIRFLEQNGGVLSKRVRTQEFSTLTDEEAKEIESAWEGGLGYGS